MKLTNLVVNQTARNIMQQFGTDIEKAHQVGDEHPNGKWVWTEYAPGKFDWRGIKKNANGTQGVAGGKKGSNDEPKGKEDEPRGKQSRDERFSEDGIVGKDGGFNKQGKTYKRWAVLREKVEYGQATPEEMKEFAQLHNQYMNEKYRHEYEQSKQTDPKAKEPKYKTVDERRAEYKRKKEEKKQITQSDKKDAKKGFSIEGLKKQIKDVSNLDAIKVDCSSSFSMRNAMRTMFSHFGLKNSVDVEWNSRSFMGGQYDFSVDGKDVSGYKVYARDRRMGYADFVDCVNDCIAYAIIKNNKLKDKEAGEVKSLFNVWGGNFPKWKINPQ